MIDGVKLNIEEWYTRTHVGDGAPLDGEVRELHVPDRLVVVLEDALARGDGHVQPVRVVDAQEQLSLFGWVGDMEEGLEPARHSHTIHHPPRGRARAVTTHHPPTW